MSQSSIMKSSVLAVLFVLTIFDDCMGIQVVDISRRHTPVGNYGPALTNFIPHHIHPYGFADVFIGPPAGTTSIGLNTGIFRAHGFIPHRHQYDGQYMAINRGAIHVAPLMGHIQSVKTTNLEAAPATTCVMALTAQSYSEFLIRNRCSHLASNEVKICEFSNKCSIFFKEKTTKTKVLL